MNEALEIANIHTIAGILDAATIFLSQRAFFIPHHTISDVALVSGVVCNQPLKIRIAPLCGEDSLDLQQKAGQTIKKSTK